MQPIVNGLETEFDNQIAFERRNANHPDGKAIMDAYGIRGHPSYLIVDPDGKLIWSFTGAVSENMIREQIIQHLNSPD